VSAALRSLLVLLTIGCLHGVAARADVFNPAYLQLSEHATGTWSAVWRVPARGRARLAMYPQFPESWRHAGDAGQRFLDGYYVETRTFEAVPDAAQRITFSGLQGGVTDVIVRVKYANGAEQVERLAPDSDVHRNRVAAEDPRQIAALRLGSARARRTAAPRRPVAPFPLRARRAILSLAGSSVRARRVSCTWFTAGTVGRRSLSTPRVTVNACSEFLTNSARANSSRDETKDVSGVSSTIWQFGTRAARRATRKWCVSWSSTSLAKSSLDSTRSQEPSPPPPGGCRADGRRVR
jgi:hypothetical protein